MTRRQSTRAPERALSMDDYPALRDFLSGYLHEDFVQDHQTPEGAVRAFRDDTRADEMQRLKDDSARLAERIKDWPWRDARLAMRTLGAAWAPGSRAALLAFLTAIAKTEQR